MVKHDIVSALHRKEDIQAGAAEIDQSIEIIKETLEKGIA